MSKGQTEVLSDALEEHGLKAGTLVPGTGRTTLALGVDDLDAALAYGCGIEIGERRGASWATGFCTDADWLVDRLVLRIEKAAKIITKAEKAKPGSTAKRDTAARGSSHVSDAMTAEKKARDLAAKEDAIPLNRDFGAALVKSYGKVPVTIDLLRLIAGMLWGDWQRARRVFERGIRYVDPQFSNEKGKVLAGVKLVDAVWAWLDRAPNVQEYAGRMMQIILASYAADQAAVSDSQRQWEKSPGESWVIEEPGTDGWAQERRLEAGSDPKNKQLLELTAAMHDFLLPVVPEAWRDRLPEPVPFVGAAVEEGLPEAA